MTKDEALQMCLEYIETDAHERKYVRHAIKAALEQAEQPAHCPWQGLTDEEIASTATSVNIEFDDDFSLSDQTIYYVDAANLIGFAQAIEAMLKERNNG